MLQSLFRRAEATVDNAIAAVLLRALALIPFLVAAGFATAGIASYLNQEFGATTGHLMMAGLFVVVGLLISVLVAMRSQTGGDAATDAAETGQAEPEAAPLLDQTDKEVLTAVLGAVGPMALPVVLRSVARNLPLVVAVAAAGFILSRSSPERQVDLQPAE